MATHGVKLVELVIERVEEEGLDVLGECGPDVDEPVPMPADVLARLTFPGGKPLSPALRRWLAFDASWLGWFADPARPVFEPRTLGRYARDEYASEWGYTLLESKFPGQCYGLYGGADSRRFLYVGEPDSTGEYPVLLLDTDDVPYLCVEYPGLDVYLAINAGVIEHRGGTYGSLLTHRSYGARMKEHAKRYFDGVAGHPIFDFGIPPEAFVDLADDVAQPAKSAVKRSSKATRLAKPTPRSKSVARPARRAPKPKAAARAKPKSVGRASKPRTAGARKPKAKPVRRPSRSR